MKISEAIDQLQFLLLQVGDCDLFDDEGYPVRSIDEAVATDYSFPDDWNMPSKFVRVKLDK